MNMIFLEDDEYYKVPNFRQVDFFNNKNLDRNIVALKKSITRINNNDYYVETKETGSSKLPIMDSNSMHSSEKVSGIRSASGYSHRLSSPFVKLRTEDEKNMRFQYNKIFLDRNFIIYKGKRRKIRLLKYVSFHHEKGLWK